jgi:hypothetical protein
MRRSTSSSRPREQRREGVSHRGGGPRDRLGASPLWRTLDSYACGSEHLIHLLRRSLGREPVMSAVLRRCRRRREETARRSRVCRHADGSRSETVFNTSTWAVGSRRKQGHPREHGRAAGEHSRPPARHGVNLWRKELLSLPRARVSTLISPYSPRPPSGRPEQTGTFGPWRRLLGRAVLCASKEGGSRWQSTWSG